MHNNVLGADYHGQLVVANSLTSLCIDEIQFTAQDLRANNYDDNGVDFYDTFQDSYPIDRVDYDEYFRLPFTESTKVIALKVSTTLDTINGAPAFFINVPELGIHGEEYKASWKCTQDNPVGDWCSLAYDDSAWVRCNTLCLTRNLFEFPGTRMMQLQNI